MIFSTWLRNWKRSLDRRWTLQQTLRRKAGARRLVSRPRLEPLEDRTLLSAVAVHSTADDGSPGTLRYAIEQVNAGKYNDIDFQIGAVGSAQTINLTNPLPDLTAKGVYINGLSQGGNGNTKQLITLNGSGAGSIDGLVLGGTDCTVSGLIIENFGLNGIQVDGSNDFIGGTTPGAGNVLIGNEHGIQLSGSGNQIQGNYIGTDTASDAKLGNGIGIWEFGRNDTIGGTVAGARNIISGNSREGVLINSGASGTVVLGNYIGTNAAGNAALANNNGIVLEGPSNTIGSTAAGAANLISGNSTDGVYLGSSGNQVLGNSIGTDLTGTTATGTDGTTLGNIFGIEVDGTRNTIGGTASGARNLLSGNLGAGVLIGFNDNLVVGNYIGTDVSGAKPLANSRGIDVGGYNNTIGGTASGAGNLISGNNTEGILIYGSGTQVLGNYIGTNAAGTAGLGNPDLPHNAGIEVYGTSTLIGGTASGAGNLISGNGADGVLIFSSGSRSLVQGNYIGTTANGKAALGNYDNGIEVFSSGSTIGGTIAAAANLISGNRLDGVVVGGQSNQVLGNSIGTDITGTKAIGTDNKPLGNSIGIDVDGVSDTIGGAASGARNLISGNSSDGVLIDSGASGNQVLGNFVGTDVSGTTFLRNNLGIYVDGTANTIGGTVSGARNLISGNRKDGILIYSGGSGNQVLGNYIGTNVAGNAALANNNGIVLEGPSNTIGGTASGAGNLISGNSSNGVYMVSLQGLLGSGNLVLGNSIGTNAAGTNALPNLDEGIEDEGTRNTIGGTASGARNLISGNLGAGVGTRNDDLVLGNYIGTDVTGAKSLANSGIGILVGGNDNTIGGTVSGARNLISGNSVFSEDSGEGVQIGFGTGNVVLGNYIGTNAAGTGAVANVDGIRVYGPSNTIGGTVSGAGNLISGNLRDGVLIESSGSKSLVQGNYIGTTADGKAALANDEVGVEVHSYGSTIGGTVSGAGNLISGNPIAGVQIYGSGTQVLGNSIGTDVSGTKSLANSVGIYMDSTNNIIGGTASAAGNLISGNSGDGILIDSLASGTSVLGNSIGLNAAGNAALANSIGIELHSDNNMVGGTASGAANLISGNSDQGVFLAGSGNVVLGNSIGTDITGTTATGTDGKPLGNRFGIDVDGVSNTIGGTASGAANLISGNSKDGVEIYTSGNQVLGNSIGTDVSGTAGLANSIGIYVDGTGNTIGGIVSGARNLISGNTSDGVQIYSGGSGNQVLGNYIGTNAAGSAALANNNGIVLEGPSNTIGGTASGAGNLISGNSTDGVYMVSLQGLSGSGNLVLGNFIGTNAAGTDAVPNLDEGIELDGARNTIGGTASGARNLLSGNLGAGVLIGFNDNQVVGNYIGTDVSGAKPLPNSRGIGVSGYNNVIGGTASGAGNLISGNSTEGILIYGSGTQVLGNYIGTNAAGTASLGNPALPHNAGIEVYGTSTLIGGTASGAGNLISGNGADGVLIFSSGSRSLVQGNYIGTTASGKAALGNYDNGIEVFSSGSTIGGTVAAAANLISGNRLDGVVVGGQSNQVLGNSIGTDAAGTGSVGNSIGIEVVGSSNTVGGTASGAGNLISGNSNDGLLIDSIVSGFQVSGTSVLGNSIGLGVTGAALGNSGYGVSIAGNNNSIGGTYSGAGNNIADNKSGGVLVSAGSGNSVSQNAIFANGSTNTGPGITLNNGGNSNLAAPSLGSATLSGSTLTVKGMFTAPTANVSYVLDFYANPTGDAEGKAYLGSLTVTPIALGLQSFTFTTTTTVTGTHPLITATLTDASGNTSAFSNGVTISSPPPPSPPSSSSTPTLSPLQEAFEVALNTAALLLQGNATALIQLDFFSMMFLGQSLPPASELLSTILSDLSVSGSAGLIGLQLGINFADSMNAPTT